MKMWKVTVESRGVEFSTSGEAVGPLEALRDCVESWGINLDAATKVTVELESE